MAVDVKQLYRTLLEDAFGNGRMEAFDECCDPGYRGHDPLGGELDVAQAKQNCAMYRSAFPGLRCTILAQCLEGDVVVTHWRMSGTHDGTLFGIAPTGAHCTVEGMSLARCRGGKVVEDWVQWDALGLLRQLGIGLGAGAPHERPPQPQPHA
jgi:predicted ester cyclase